MQIEPRLSACSKTSVRGHGGLREARMGRASIVRGARLQGEVSRGTHVLKVKYTGTISQTVLCESDLSGRRIDVAGEG